MEVSRCSTRLLSAVTGTQQSRVRRGVVSPDAANVAKHASMNGRANRSLSSFLVKPELSDGERRTFGFAQRTTESSRIPGTSTVPKYVVRQSTKTFGVRINGVGSTSVCTTVNSINTSSVNIDGVEVPSYLRQLKISFGEVPRRHENNVRTKRAFHPRLGVCVPARPSRKKNVGDKLAGLFTVIRPYTVRFSESKILRCGSVRF